MTDRIDWPSLFLSVFESVSNTLSIVLQAAGCREGWLQGEFFRYGHSLNIPIDVNDFDLGNRQKADLSSDHHPKMVAEIKIVGADYQSKMIKCIESDVERLRRLSEEWERYMILVAPQANARARKSKLGVFLDTCSFGKICDDREFGAFRVRIWRVEQP